MMKKKLLAILTCLCAVFTALGFSSCFELETIDIDGYSLYLEEDGTYTIVGIPDEIYEQTTWEIPEKIGEYPISYVGKHVTTGLMSSEEVFASFGRVRHIIVPKGVGGIRAENLYNLKIIQTEVTPSHFSVMWEDERFWWYSPQEEYKVDGIEYKYLTDENFVGDLVFTTEITHVDVSENIEEAVETATLLFALGSGELTIPETYKDYPVTKIGSEAFLNSLYTSVTIDEHIVEIGENAFEASKLEHVSLPEACTIIPDGAFVSSQLKEITIPQTVTEIGRYAFAFCQLTDVTVPQSVETIKEHAFAGNPLENADLSACSISTVDAYAFLNCPLTGKLLLPDTVVKIDSGAFYGSKMSEFSFPAQLLSIGSGAFRKVPLEKVELPNTLHEIHGGAFRDNTALTELILPDACNSFDNTAIYGCTNLKKLHLGNVIGFEYVEYTCENLAELSVSETNPELFMQEGMLYRKTDEGTTLIKCPTAVKVNKLVLKDCFLAKNAFSNHHELKELELGRSDGVWFDIPSRAFYNCTGLEKVSISGNIVKIRSQAFSGCTSLSEINLGEVIEFHESSFFGCSSLEEADFTSAQFINAHAFEGCNLKEIHTYHVRSIHSHAFANNPNLWKVTIEDCGYVGSEAFAGCKKLAQYSDGGAQHGSEVFKDTPYHFFYVGCKGCMRIG